VPHSYSSLHAFTVSFPSYSSQDPLHLPLQAGVVEVASSVLCFGLPQIRSYEITVDGSSGLLAIKSMRAGHIHLGQVLQDVGWGGQLNDGEC
jgi:hypothetical protein